MKKAYTAILSAAFIFGIHSASQATIIYVRAAATGANNGTSWTDAFTDLQAGFGATLPGDTVWVAAGVYKPTTTTTRTISFALPDGVKVFGGFDGTETYLAERDYITNVTNLSGDIGITGNSTDNSYHVVTTHGVNNGTELDGVRILSGRANGNSGDGFGGGIYNSGGNPVVRNCTIQNNNGLSASGVCQGSAGGTLTLINCNITSNASTGTTSVSSGAIGVTGGTINILGCSITQNSGQYGAAVHMQGGNTYIDRTVISGNSANVHAGAIYGFDDCMITITNSLIVGNSANSGSSVLYCVSAPAVNHRMINCTVAHNRASSASQAAVIFGSNSSVYNCIFYGNSETDQVSSNNITIASTLEQGVNLNDPHFVAPGNSSLAPFSAAGYDYRVKAFSPAVDYANASYLIPAYNMDLSNGARVQGPAPDAGAYEAPGCTFDLSISSPDSTSICAGNTTTLTANAGNWFLWNNFTTNPSLTTNIAGIYTLEADSAGCYGYAQYMLTLIYASVSITGPNGFCPGDTIALNATGNNLDTYSWSNGDTTSSILVSAAGTYSVAITTTAGCTASSSVNITAYTAPNPVITFSSPVISTTTTFASYQWLLNGAPVSGATAQQYTVLQNGNYSVVVTNANGCSDTSAAYNITDLAMNETQAGALHVYPNPADDVVNIAGNGLSEAAISVRNATGQDVNVTVIQRTADSALIDISALNNGLYFLFISNEAGTARVALIKQ
jgi:hypothetical protein